MIEEELEKLTLEEITNIYESYYLKEIGHYSKANLHSHIESELSKLKNISPIIYNDEEYI